MSLFLGPIDKCDVITPAASPAAWVAGAFLRGCSTAVVGRNTLTHVPVPPLRVLLRNLIEPPALSATARLAQRPSPAPFCCLVEKKGLNTWGQSFGSMPRPSSMMEIRTPRRPAPCHSLPRASRILTDRAPLSTAFSSRFANRSRMRSSRATRSASHRKSRSILTPFELAMDSRASATFLLSDRL